jgi:hypothetical protein
MTAAWASADNRMFEQVEIIDIKPEELLACTWDQFTRSQHYRITDDYFTSLLGFFPRRSCEAMWKERAEAMFLDYESANLPCFHTMREMWDWFASVQAYEHVSK